MDKLTSALLFIATFIFYKISFAANACLPMVHNSQTSNYSSEISIIIGTDRESSNSAVVAAEIAKQSALNPNVKINIIDLAKLPKSVFKSDYFSKKPAAFNTNFVDPVERSSGLIFVIPEYDGAAPGILSYYMNHMRANLEQKPVALVGISSGKWGARAALDGFKGTLTHRKASVLGYLQVNIEHIDNKVQDNRLTDLNAQERIADLAKSVINYTNMFKDSLPSQKTLAQAAQGLLNKNLEIHLNNKNSIEGKFANFVLNDNGTLAYVQFSGPTKIKNNGQVIPGQNVEVHNLGYGMPVGAIQNFKKSWYKKENLAAQNLKIGKRVKLEYESGIIVDGKIKNLTLDTAGNLMVITFTDVVVNNKADVLFQKEWGDFDIAVADYIEEFNPTN